MSVIRFDEMVPEVYVKESRDFQVISRLFTLGFNNAKYNANELLYLNDANLIDDSLLPLLQRKVGFYTSKEFTSDEIRQVCKVFYSLVRNKGSLEAIEEAIRIFFQIQNINTSAYINIINKVYKLNSSVQDNEKSYILDNEKSYILEIGINYGIMDTTLLMEMLKYILPTGYYINIFFYESSKFELYLESHSVIKVFSSKADTLYESNVTGDDVFTMNSVDTTTIYKGDKI